MDLSVLTLNVWGAPYGKHRGARMKLIGERLVAMQADIVLLQEVFLQDNRDALLAILTDGGYRHFHYYASGLLGSGLLTVSKHPIVDVAFLRYRMGGKPLMLKHGDYYAGKGIGLARVRVDGHEVDVYNIHPHAQYDMRDDNPYAVYTDSHLYEAGRFIQAHSAKRAVVLGGDFNVRPEQSGYQLIRAMTGLGDAYAGLHGEDAVTFAPQNAYVKSPAQSLDYVMVGDGDGLHVQVTGCDVVMTDVFDLEVDGAEQFSDHYGILATLRLTEGEGGRMLDGGAIRVSLMGLQKRLDEALHDTLLEQGAHQERALLSGASFFDVWLMSGFIGRIVPRWGLWLRRWGRLMSLGLAVYFLLQGRVNLEARRQTLEALRDEVALGLKHKV